MKWQTVSLLGLCLAIGCAAPWSKEVTYTETVDPKVRNGFVDEVATLESWGDAKVLVAPLGTHVHVSKHVSSPEVTLRKKLALYSHPSNRISIDEVRYSLGIAARREGDRVTLARVGEFSDNHHGGSSVEISVVVPPTVKVDLENGLAGKDSLDRHATFSDHIGSAWTRIPTSPLPKKR